MSKYYVFWVLISLFLIVSCKDKPESADAAESETVAEQVTTPFSINNGGKYTSIAKIRSQASAIIDDRINKDNNAQASLTYAYWYPEFLFNKTMSAADQFKGCWLKFEDDFTYSYGLYDEIQGGGRYHFRLDDKAVVMLDNKEEVEPKFWTVKQNNRAMAWVGGHDLGINNGMQMKLLSLDTKPKK